MVNMTSISIELRHFVEKSKRNICCFRIVLFFCCIICLIPLLLLTDKTPLRLQRMAQPHARERNWTTMFIRNDSTTTLSTVGVPVSTIVRRSTFITSLSDKQTGFSISDNKTGFSISNNKTEFSLCDNKTGFSLSDNKTRFSLSDNKTGFSLSYNKTGFSLLIVVITAPPNTARRSVIRQTWTLNLPKNAKVFFAVGMKFLNSENKTALDDENKLNQDLIMLPHLEDKYDLLTDKVVEFMKWIGETSVFDYLLKVDDDTFVRVDKLVNALQLKPRDKLYWGFFNNGSEIVKEGKWAEPEPYICDKYVSYALGGGYVLSKDLVTYIVDNSDKFKKFVNEDVSVGTWLAPLTLNVYHDERFRMKGACREDQIVFHESSIEDMHNFNKSIELKNSFCGLWVQRTKGKSGLRIFAKLMLGTFTLITLIMLVYKYSK